jgi:hypothetical protein
MVPLTECTQSHTCDSSPSTLLTLAWRRAARDLRLTAAQR